jgi:hypothetical protein
MQVSLEREPRIKGCSASAYKMCRKEIDSWRTVPKTSEQTDKNFFLVKVAL